MSFSREDYPHEEAALLFRKAVDDLVAALGRLDSGHLEAVRALATDVLWLSSYATRTNPARTPKAASAWSQSLSFDICIATLYPKSKL